MNRSRVIYRDPNAEGSQDAQAAALALAQIVDRPMLESLIHHFSALREFGGETYIGAVRGGDSKSGHFTGAYVVGYTEKTRIKANPTEQDQSFAEVEIELPPEAEEEELQVEAEPVGA